MRWLVVGAGAIGGWLAARLALAGEAVAVVARGATAERIARHGLTLHSGGQVHTVPLPVATDAHDAPPADVLLVCTKAPALPALMPQLLGRLAPGGVLMSAANGLPWWYFQPAGVACQGLALDSVDPGGALLRQVPMAPVLGLSVAASCHVPEPGVVVHSAGRRLVLGEPGGGLSPRATAIAQRLCAAGFEAEASADIRLDIWLKLLGNACFNPVSLLTGARTDRMIDEPRLHALFVRMMDEAVAVGVRLGLPLAVDPLQRIAQTRRLGAIQTSMLQDLQAGRPVELDAILGALVACAGAVAMPVPTLDAVLGMARLRAEQAGLLPAPAP